MAYNGRMVYETQFSRISFNQLSVALKQRWQDLTDAGASPQTIALSFAVGTFISVLPIPGIDLALIALLGSLFKQLNRTGMLAAVAVWNTFVVAPLYILSQKIGSSLPLLSDQSLVIGFLVGNFLLAVVVTAVSYIIVQIGVGRYQTQKVRA